MPRDAILQLGKLTRQFFSCRINTWKCLSSCSLLRLSDKELKFAVYGADRFCINVIKTVPAKHISENYSPQIGLFEPCWASGYCCCYTWSPRTGKTSAERTGKHQLPNQRYFTTVYFAWLYLTKVCAFSWYHNYAHTALKYSWQDRLVFNDGAPWRPNV